MVCYHKRSQQTTITLRECRTGSRDALVVVEKLLLKTTMSRSPYIKDREGAAPQILVDYNSHHQARASTQGYLEDHHLPHSCVKLCFSVRPKPTKWHILHSPISTNLDLSAAYVFDEAETCHCFSLRILLLLAAGFLPPTNLVFFSVHGDALTPLKKNIGKKFKTHIKSTQSLFL